MFILLLLCIPMWVRVAEAQNEKVKFHTLKECQYDTLKFVNKNYGYDSSTHGKGPGYGYGMRYILQPLQVLFDEAKGEGVKFRSFCWDLEADGKITFIVFLEPVEKAREKIAKGKYCVCFCAITGISGEENRAEVKSLKRMKLYPIDKRFMKWVKFATIYGMDALTYGHFAMPKE